MSEEAQVFRGDRPVEGAETGGPPVARKVPNTIIAKADLPAGEPVGDQPEPVAEAPAAEVPVAEAVADLPLETEPEPPYNFEIDPETLWSMPPAMQERLSNLSSAAAVVHQQLDEQEKETARITKLLKALDQ